MKTLFKTLPLASLAGALGMLSASCSSDLTPGDYPASAFMKLEPYANSAAIDPSSSAYRDIKWGDSVAQVEASLKGVHPWTGDPFGVYVRGRLIEEVEKDVYAAHKPPLKEGEKPDADKDLANAKKLLSQDEDKNFIVRKINFEAGKSEVVIYWFEINDPKRPSRFVDSVIWSKMCMVRIRYSDPPVAFSDVLASQTKRNGAAPEIRELKDSDLWKWYHKKVDPKESYHPEKEHKWRVNGLTALLYDWKDPEEKQGHSELILMNERVFEEFEGKVRERIELLRQQSSAKVEESKKQALGQ